MNTQPLLSVVIPTRNRPDYLRALIQSLQASTHKPDEIIVVDDYVEEDVLERVRQAFPDVVFVQLSKRGYITGACNTGWLKSQGRFVFFVDDDNEVAADCLELCLETMNQHPEAGVVGAKTMYFDEPERIRVAGANIRPSSARTDLIGLNQLDGPHYQKILKVDTVPNAYMVRREVLEAVDGIDEKIVQTWSEADRDARIRAKGYDVLVDGRARVYHHSSLVDRSNLAPRHVGGTPFRMYYLTRNRYVYMARYTPLWEKLTFTLIFSNLYIVYYGVNMLRAGRWDLIYALLIGALDGLWYTLTGRFTKRDLTNG